MNDLASSQQESTFGLMDFFLLLLLSSILFVLCIITSHRHLFWSDELFGYSLIHNPTYLQTMRGWWNGADGGPPLYYFFGRTWGLAFGFSEISQRLFSTSGMSASLFMVWIMARRFYPLVAVAPAVTLVYLIPAVMIWQAENGRFYGLYLATAAFACLVFLRLADRLTLTRTDLVLTFAAAFLLIGSHTLGIIFTAGLLCAMIALDLFRSRLRWPLYLANFAGCIAFPLSLHAIRQAAAIARDGFWTVKPSLTTLAKGSFLYNRDLLKILALLVVLAVAASLLGRGARAADPQGRSALSLAGRLRTSRQLPVLFLLAALYAAELVIFIKSQFGVSIFADRYLLPLVIAIVLLLSFCLTAILHAKPLQRFASPSLALAPILVLIGLCALHASHLHTYDVLYPDAGFDARLEAKLPPSGTVVTTFLPYYTFLRTYDHRHNIIFLQDWTYDLDPRNGHPDLSGQHMMDDFGKSGYGEIASCNDIVARHGDFTLLSETGRDTWLNKRLAHNSEVQLTKIAENDEWYPAGIYHVHRVDPTAATVCR